MFVEDKKIIKLFDDCNKLLATSRTMQDIFLMSTSLHKKEKALTWLNEKGKPVSYKYKHYKSHVFEFASKLSQKLAHVPFESIVALKLRNCPDWPLIFWGLLMAGYIPLLIDAKLPKENTEVLLKESEASAIVTQEMTTYSVPTININILKEVKTNFKFAANWANNVIFCSSGTTGNVKLMIYDGSNICAQIAAAKEMGKETKDIMYPGEINIISIIPFHHIFGFTAVFLWYTFFGKNIVFTREVSPKEIMSVSQKCGVTHVYSVPLFWDSLAQSVIRKAELEGPKKSEILDKMIAYNTGKISAEEAGISSSPIAVATVQSQLLGRKVKYCISGGGYLSGDTLNTINGIGYHLYNGYGMTEAGVTSVELSNDVNIRLKGSIGHPLNGIEYKIIPTNKKEPKTGELLIKSPIIHKEEIVDGVRREPELEDGFMHTGDIASCDETGRYYLKGRIKDIIINENGENIYPDEIEDYFKEIKGVQKLCVVGVKKGKNNHEQITCVMEISSELNEDDLDALKEECNRINNTLSNEKRVNEFLLSKIRLPLTASMKVKRFQIKQMLEKKNSNFVGFNEKKTVKTFDGYRKEDVEPIVKKVRSIFAKILILPIIKVGDDDHWINDLGGDSMSYVELINSINKEFEIAIPEDKYAILTSVNEFSEEVLILKGVKKVK